MARILIKNGRVWDGEKFCYCDVLTDGDTIERIAPNINEKATFVYNAEGKTVSAGLVDIHTHMKGIKQDPYGISADMSCIPFGVTAALDAGGAHASEELVNNFQIKALALASANIRDDKADFSEFEEKRLLYGNKIIGIKVYLDTTDENVRSIAPLREVCAYARERGLIVMVHCAHSPVKMSEILDTLGKGDILTHSYHGDENNAQEDGFESIIAAKKRGIIIDAGFAGNVHTNYAIFKRAVERGALPDTISTDITKYSAYIRGGRYGMTMCMSMARHMGMSETDIFRAVTSAPARAVGKDGEWGFLKEGGAADVAVLDYTKEPFSITDGDGNRIESDMGYRCVLTISDGQIVYKD